MRGDYEAARRHLEDTVDLYHRNGAPFETARARLRLARTLLATGRIRSAWQLARAAYDALHRLGAAREAARAKVLLREIEAVPENLIAGTPASGELTPREVDVLRLIASGKSNQEIAAFLVLSVRTVERHISNIYAKIGATGAVARATATAYALHRGLVQPRNNFE